MKKLFLLLALLLIASPAMAEPWLVCKPQADADGYVYKLNGGAEVTVIYEDRVLSNGETWALICDVGDLPVGPFSFEVRAYRDDPVWGRVQSAAVPFDSSRPGIGSPSETGIRR